MVSVKVDGLSLAQVFRRECTSCGSEGLRWFGGRRFATTAGGRAMLVDVVAASNGALTMREVLNGEVWVCRGCGELGVFA